MRIASTKTHKITIADKNIFSILKQYIKKLNENSILAITSKIVAICEGRLVNIKKDFDKKDLIQKEADYYLPAEINKYGYMITIKNNLLIPTAGIDESNGNGKYVLWPANPQKSANEIRNFLRKSYNLQNIGVIITDSKTTLLRWGGSGVCIAHVGFQALNSYIHTPDLFGRYFKMTKANIMDALAAAAVLVMGEGNGQTPLAIIEDIPFVKFKKNNPSKKEIASLKISIDDDIYASLLKGVEWRRGNKFGRKIVENFYYPAKVQTHIGLH